MYEVNMENIELWAAFRVTVLLLLSHLFICIIFDYIMLNKHTICLISYYDPTNNQDSKVMLCCSTVNESASSKISTYRDQNGQENRVAQ